MIAEIYKLMIPAAVGENHGETAVGSGERWFYEGQASEELVITTGSDWDTLLYLYDVNALEIARDDDGGPNLNSQIRFILPEDGRYVIEVRGYQDQHGGVYTLTIESSLVEPTTATPTPTPNATP
jgi:hypothetical protein